jgi:hypothetical protein
VPTLPWLQPWGIAQRSEPKASGLTAGVTLSPGSRAIARGSRNTNGKWNDFSKTALCTAAGSNRRSGVIRSFMERRDKSPRSRIEEARTVILHQPGRRIRHALRQASRSARLRRTCSRCPTARPTCKVGELVRVQVRFRVQRRRCLVRYIGGATGERGTSTRVCAGAVATPLFGRLRRPKNDALLSSRMGRYLPCIR